MKKKPIGIMPRKLWEQTVREERLKNLLSAIERYEKANEPIANEWNKEYLDLTLELGLYKTQ
jgi:uncharacterized protein (UPF0335 family)